MENGSRTNVPEALRRVLKQRKSRLRSKNHWGVLAELPQSTVLDAFREGKNPTVETLSALATAAGMTLAEMLEYGDQDWEKKAAARALLRKLSDKKLAGLVQALEDDLQENPDA